MGGGRGSRTVNKVNHQSQDEQEQLINMAAPGSELGQPPRVPGREAMTESNELHSRSHKPLKMMIRANIILKQTNKQPIERH